MAAIYLDQTPKIVSTLVKRDNFASRNPGVILVFAIVGAIAILLIGLFINKKMKARKALKEAQAGY